jgi:hypothetical protein
MSFIQIKTSKPRFYLSFNSLIKYIDSTLQHWFIGRLCLRKIGPARSRRSRFGFPRVRHWAASWEDLALKQVHIKWSRQSRTLTRYGSGYFETLHIVF